MNLFRIINDEISLDLFKTNLDNLRQTESYKKMFGVAEKCKVNVSGFNVVNEVERKKRLLKEEIFVYEFVDAECKEYLPAKNNRMRINLFDTQFVKQFESIFAVIDQRIIQLLSSNKQQTNSNGNNRRKEQ